MSDKVTYHKQKASLPTGSILSSQTKKGGNIIYVRHGETKLNSENRIRAWKDVPLDEGGKKEATKLGGQLKGKIDVIVTSDLKRAAHTAHIISDETGVPVHEETEGLRPWHLGKYAGQDVEKTLEALKEHAQDHPDKTVEGGESFNKFKNRFVNELNNIMAKHASKNVAVVSHHRGDRMLESWEKHGNPTKQKAVPDLFFKKGMEPGTYRVVKFADLQK